MVDVLAAPHDQLVGRDAERARIDRFVAAVPTGSHALTIRGDPGIGKTALWRHAVEQCRGSGFLVLVARPAEEELLLTDSGLVDLFEDVDHDAAVLGSEWDTFARGRAILGVLRGLSASRPVVVAIDDVQWLDPASAHALRIALRRLDDEPVGVLTTAPSGPAIDDRSGVAGAMLRDRTETIDLGPLSPEALREVLGRVGSAISRPTLRRIHEVSVGNPLYALELTRGLDHEARSDITWRVLPLPSSLHSAIAQRLGSMPSDLVPLLEITAALGRTTVRDIREMLPGVQVEQLLTTAHKLDLLVVENDLVVRCAHPLIGSTVYAAMNPLARRSLHARLAERCSDPEQRARHLGLSTDGPDAEVAVLVEEAAERAARRRAFTLAAELAELSHSRTPPDDLDGIRRRTTAEVGYLAAAGEVGRALRIADELIAGLPPGPGRAEVLIRRAELESDDLEAGQALLEQALDDAGDDELLRGRILDQLGWLRGHFRGDLAVGLAFMRDALSIAIRLGNAELEISASSGLGNLESFTGHPRRDLFERAVALEHDLEQPLLWSGARGLLAADLRQSGELAEARTLFDQLNRESAGSERWRPYALYQYAGLECAAGNLAEAEDLIRLAIEAAHDNEDTHVDKWALYTLAFVAAWRGRVEESRSALGRILAWSAARGERPATARARSLLGLLSLSEGDAGAAATDLVAAAELLHEMGIANPGAVPALPDAIEALACSDDIASAEELLGRLEDQARSLNNPLVSALADRSRGIVLAAQRETGTAVTLLSNAATAFDEHGLRLEAARSLLALGRAYLRGGQRSRGADALADAHERFAAVGATLWQARTAEDLERAAPGRATGELTTSERRVAVLVAQGRRNREIGTTLSMSVATVEAHLTRIYRKLHIRSRSELTRHMSHRGAADET